MAKAKGTAETAAADEAASDEPMFEPRRATGDVAKIGYTAADGSQETIEPDSDGVFWPKSAEEVAVLDSFGLVHARKAAAELKAAAAAADATPDAQPAAAADGKE